MVREGIVLLMAVCAFGQQGPHPGDWKTWVISSGKEHGVPPPPDATATKGELEWVRSATNESSAAIGEQIRYWDSGPPSYRWMEMIAKRQSAGEPVGTYFVRAYAYASIAMYDATVAAWNAKREYARVRPTQADGAIVARVPVPQSYSYPSDYAATAAAAAMVMAYLVPAEADMFMKLAEEAGKSRLYAGVEHPSDYFAGWELGKRVAEAVIARARQDGADVAWAGTIPAGRCLWTGTNPGNISAANWKPLLLSTPGEFRPAPPPSCDSADVQGQVADVRNFPRTLTAANMMTNARALYWQTPEGVYPWAILQLNQWVLEDKMEHQPAKAARAYALVSAAGYDAFVASQDGKFTYWYLRPAQLDPAVTTLFPAPNFPSYPSNHSTLSSSRAEVMAHLYPERAAGILALAKEAGDSRIWAGIHYEMDNQAGVTLGKNVAGKYIAWAANDGSH